MCAATRYSALSCLSILFALAIRRKALGLQKKFSNA
jgi:hypothetical protein